MIIYWSNLNRLYIDFKGPFIHGVAYYLIFAWIIGWLFLKCGLFIVKFWMKKNYEKKEIANLTKSSSNKGLMSTKYLVNNTYH